MPSFLHEARQRKNTKATFFLNLFNLQALNLLERGGNGATAENTSANTKAGFTFFVVQLQLIKKLIREASLISLG